MDFGNELKKAMIDNDINGAKELAAKADMSYNKVIRALNSDGSSRYRDVIELCHVLGLNISITKGGK